MAINISKIQEIENKKSSSALLQHENHLCDLVQIMALHRSGFNLNTLREVAPEVMKEYKDRGLGKAEEVRGLCGYFTQQLHRLLGDHNPRVSAIWEGIRAVSLNQTSQEALEVAQATLFDVLRGKEEAQVQVVKKVEEKVVVTEPSSPVAYEDKFEDSPLANNEVLKAKKLASERSKQGAKTRAAKKASMLSKEA